MQGVPRLHLIKEFYDASLNFLQEAFLSIGLRLQAYLVPLSENLDYVWTLLRPVLTQVDKLESLLVVMHGFVVILKMFKLSSHIEISNSQSFGNTPQ